MLALIPMIATVLAVQANGAAPPDGAARPEAPPTIPKWAIGATWYVVNVPNFANGDRTNDPPGTLDWPTAYPSRPNTVDDNSPSAAPAYGGDLAGLTIRLVYLQDLGVDTLYLLGYPRSPATSAGDAADPEFIKFIEKAHALGFRVVLRLDHPSDPAEVPNTDSLSSVTRRWMDPDGDGRSDDGVDGWVVPWPAPFSADALQRWRTQAKSLNASALIVANAASEVGTATESGIFDTVVNYAAGDAIHEFLNDLDPPTAPAKLFAALGASHAGLTHNARLAAPVPLCGFGTDDPGRGVAPLDPARRRLAFVLQHFFAGSPAIGFGDEIGLCDARSSARPRVMLWPDLPGTETSVRKTRDDLASLIQWLSARRGVDPPLTRGEFRKLLADGDRRLLAFARTAPDGDVVLVVNYGSAKQLVSLPVARPGETVSVLTPIIDPEQKLLELGRHKAPSADHIPPRRMAASRQRIRDDGLARLWVAPMSVRVVLTAAK